MTKFENVGITLQEQSISKQEAEQRFIHSCRLCSEKMGLRIECDRCGIKFTNSLVIAAYDDINNTATA